jgi:hypothetical protein
MKNWLYIYWFMRKNGIEDDIKNMNQKKLLQLVGVTMS